MPSSVAMHLATLILTSQEFTGHRMMTNWRRHYDLIPWQPKKKRPAVDSESSEEKREGASPRRNREGGNNSEEKEGAALRRKREEARYKCGVGRVGDVVLNSKNVQKIHFRWQIHTSGVGQH